MKILSAKWRPYCRGLNVLNGCQHTCNAIFIQCDLIPWTVQEKHRDELSSIILHTWRPWSDSLYAGARSMALQWRHNEGYDVSNHRRLDCLLKRLLRHRSRKTWTLRVTGLCEGNSPVTGEFPSQRTSNAENVSITSTAALLALKQSMLTHCQLSPQE